MTEHHRIAIGVRGSMSADTAATVAAAAEAYGFGGLWVSDSAQGNALAALTAAAAATTSIELAAGVLPMDRWTTDEILAASASVPRQRLTLGIGAGRAAGGLNRVRTAITALRSATPATIMVGSLGPKMQELGAQYAHGLVLNWLSPGDAAQVSNQAAMVAGRRVRSALYVRTLCAVRDRAALTEEISRKAERPAYRAQQIRTGTSPQSTVLDLTEGPDPAMSAYLSAVETVVLRIAPERTNAESYLDRIGVVAAAYLA